MSDWAKRHKTPYVYNSKSVKEGTVEIVIRLKKDGKTFDEIGKYIGKSRQRASQIYYKGTANGYYM